VCDSEDQKAVPTCADSDVDCRSRSNADKSPAGVSSLWTGSETDWRCPGTT